MDRLMYGSLSGMRAAMARQAAVANNLANASTPGFRAELSATRPLWVSGNGLDSRALASEEVMSADMSQGAIAHTGRDLDVALQKDALLAVQAKSGEESYTRRGDLQVSDSGLMTTGDGTPVVGESGPVTLPPYDKLIIGADGVVTIVPQGGDPANPQRVDQLKLVSPKGSQIAKGLDGLFRVEGGGTLPADPDAKVTQGAIEGSNVNTAQALVEMIEASRGWENQVKMMSTARQVDTDASDLMKLPT